MVQPGRYRPRLTLNGLLLVNRNTLSRMLKKPVQQGRSERRGEEVPTALCVAVRP